MYLTDFFVRFQSLALAKVLFKQPAVFAALMMVPALVPALREALQEGWRLSGDKVDTKWRRDGGWVGGWVPLGGVLAMAFDHIEDLQG